MFKDAATMAQLVPITSEISKEDRDIMKAGHEEHSCVYSCCTEEDKAILVAINEKRGRKAEYNHEAFNVEDYPNFFGFK